ncbi:MAG: response regulator [Magnetococcales bacterium]|nr:response regulator [Magnetococcales bacterium]
MGSILIVEDSKSFASLLKQRIQVALGYQVVLATSLENAREVLENHLDTDFSLALLDLHLPDAPDGEIVDLMLSRSIPAIVLTATYKKKLQEKILKKGILDYFVKDNIGVVDSVIHAIDRIRRNRGHHILVVDDSRSARGLVCHTLKRYGFHLLEAKDGLEALEILNREPISLMVTDFKMPEMDGLQLMKKLRTHHSRDKVAAIGLSSATDPGLAVAFIKAGANDFLVKPFQPEELLCRVYQNIDIIERHQELQQMVTRHQSVLDNALDAIITIDHAGRVLDFNPAAEELFAYTEKQAAGQDIADLIIPPHLREPHKNALVRSQSGQEGELRRRFELPGQRSDGKVIDLQISLTAIKQAKNPQYTAFIQDITDRKQLLISLEETLQVAESANRAKSEFIANTSHEIRTPMNAVLGFTDLALKAKISPKVRDYLGKIENASRSLMGIINDILDFSKIDAGRMNLDPVKFDIHDLLDRLADLFSKQVADKGIELLFLAPLSFDQVLHGDVMRIEQILINLIRNAVKFTDDGGITVRATLETVGNGQIKIAFSIQDSGVGINSENLPRLFSPFVQADGSTTRKYGGTGLGLSICKRLVNLMDGEIWAESSPGEGSEFAFFVMVEHHSENRRKKRTLPKPLQGKKALIAAHNPIFQLYLQELLTEMGLIPTTVFSGKEALAELLAHNSGEAPYDFTFLDWNLPKKSGIDSAAEIRATLTAASPSCRLPQLCLLTPFGIDAIRIEGEKAGVDLFLDKPVVRSRLIQVLTEEAEKESKEEQTEAEQKVIQDRRSKKVLGLEEETGEQVAGSRILLVEDNEINQQVARELLERVGLVVETANNGLEALRLLERLPFDAVLMDLQMPEMDGYEATARIRQDLGMKDLPILAMTAHSSTEEKERVNKSGMNGHVDKPIRPERLYGLISKAISRPLPSTQQMAVTIEGETLEEIPGLDIQSGLERLGGNHKLYRRLLVRFLEEYGQANQKIRDLLEKKAFQKAAVELHTIRGVAGNLGAVQLYESTGQLENAIGESNPIAIKATSARFFNRMNALIRELGGMEPGTSEAIHINLPDKGSLRENPEQTVILLEDLARHLEIGSIEVASLMSALAQTLEAASPAIFQELKKQISDYHYREALQIIHDITASLDATFSGRRTMVRELEKERVLIVDDQRSNIDVLAEILSEFDRMVALNGRRALQIAQSDHPPDIILLDIMMPEMDGYEVCRRLKGDPQTQEIPVLFVTAKKEVADEAEGLSLGGVDYITKPFQGEIVRRRVLNHLELKRHRDRLENVVKLRTTELQAAKREAEKGRAAAEAGNRAKSEFLATMSHEIRTPLNAILGMGELLQETEVSEEQGQYLTTLHKAGESLLALISDILDLSKIESGQWDMEEMVFDLHELVTGSLEIQENIAREKNIELKLNLDPEVPQYVSGDPNRLRQIVLNLLGNAIKFTPAGKVSFSIEKSKTKNTPPTQEEMIHFTVTDTGIGISQDKLESIFQPFVQADSTTTRRFGGTGLGLTICQKLVERMDGHIRVESQPGQGGTFHFEIPLAASEPTPVSPTPPEAPREQRRRRENPTATPGLSILLVEDNEDNRLLIETFLKKSAHRLDYAQNGREGLEMFMAKPYDVVLMDIQMPVMDGYTATRGIRTWESKNHAGHTPVAALTAHAMHEHHELVMEAGCDHHLSKPIRKQNLLDFLARIEQEEKDSIQKTDKQIPNG